MVALAYEIDFAAPPERRWKVLDKERGAVQTLVHQYVQDLGGLEPVRGMLQEYAESWIQPKYQRELEGIARAHKQDPMALLLVNVYYDMFKHMLACTAFAVASDQGPLHARNLDWWTENKALGRFSTRFSCTGGSVRTPVEFVSWPGMIGTFSGVATGRFAVTMNAVLSEEPHALAAPVSLLIREVLFEAREYDEAVERLAETTIPGDCLLLVSGITNDEMCVIERTPRRAEIRGPTDGVVAVANDYRALDVGSGEGLHSLARTACARYERARGKAKSLESADLDSCLKILNDRTIRQGITVQQMVLSARLGTLFAAGVV